MAVFQVDNASIQTKQVLIEGVPGKIILVTRVCFSANGSGVLQFWSDPGGADEQTVTANLRVISNDTMDIVLGRRFGLAAERGKALGASSSSAGPSQNHSIIIWYELVD